LALHCPARLAFLGFTFIAILNSFSDVRHRIPNIVLPFVHAFITSGFFRGLPAGPCDISLLFPTGLAARGFAATAVFYLGCGYAVSITRLCEVYRQLHNPRDGLLKTTSYFTFAKRFLGVPSQVLELFLKCIPGNIFLFIVVRFIWPFLWDWAMDTGFVAIELLAGIARIWIARDCVQLLILTKSLQGLALLDDKRTTAAVRKARRANHQSILSICSNMIAFLTPGCVNVAMVLLYAVSWAIDGREMATARIVSMFVLAASDFFIATQQFKFAD
jgi:hypothetical protein